MFLSKSNIKFFSKRKRFILDKTALFDSFGLLFATIKLLVYHVIKNSFLIYSSKLYNVWLSNDEKNSAFIRKNLQKYSEKQSLRNNQFLEIFLKFVYLLECFLTTKLWLKETEKIF